MRGTIRRAVAGLLTNRLLQLLRLLRWLPLPLPLIDKLAS